MVMALCLGNLCCSPNCTAVKVDQTPLRRRMRKHHAATAPIAGGRRPGAWRSIAHPALLRQRQGNAALLQIRGAPAAGQGGLEGSEVLCEVRPGWGGLTRCWWRCGSLPGCYRWLPGKRRWRLATAWHALAAGWRPPEGGLALLLFTPLCTRRFHIAPGATGKAHEAAAVHLHAQAALAVGAVERAQGAQHVATFADNRAAGGEVGFGQRPILTERVTRNAHTCASSLMVPRSGRKMSPTLPVSPCRFFATVSSTARAGGVAIRSCASVRNSTTSAAYSRSPLSLSESSAAVPLPFP